MISITYIACLLVASSAASPARSLTRRCGGSVVCPDYTPGSFNFPQGPNFFNGGGYSGGFGAGGPLGGNGLAVSHQDQQQQQQYSGSNSNSYSNGGIEYGSSSQFTQQSSSSSSSTTVVNTFSSLDWQIRQLQNLIATSSITQQTLIQQMSQLAISFQSALSLGQSCNSCFNQGNFPPSFGGVFQQLAQLLSLIQSSYGASYNQICAPFSGLASYFQSFFRTASSSEVSFNSMVPATLPDLLNRITPQFGQNLYNL